MAEAFSGGSAALVFCRITHTHALLLNSLLGIKKNVWRLELQTQRRSQRKKRERMIWFFFVFITTGAPAEVPVITLCSDRPGAADGVWSASRNRPRETEWWWAEKTTCCSFPWNLPVMSLRRMTSLRTPAATPHLSQRAQIRASWWLIHNNPLGCHRMSLTLDRWKTDTP